VPQVDQNGGGIVEPAARFGAPAAEPTPRSRRNRPAPEEAPTDDAQLFARWERDALPSEETLDEEDDDVDILARTPEQEARRAWLLRLVALLIGFFAVIGGFAVFKGKDQVPPMGSAAPATSAQAPVAKAAASSTAAPPAPSASEEPAAPPAPQRLPVVDVEIPAAPDPATEQAWEWAAQGLTANDFKVADKAFAELGKRTDPPTRETARLARALWWINNGREAEVRPVIADLAVNATTPSVRRRARELMQH
jgi:hypothetical protein